jgi:glucose-6-phosphate 1-epimerase
VLLIFKTDKLRNHLKQYERHAIAHTQRSRMNITEWPSGITPVKLGPSQELDGLKIKTAYCQALISLQGAQVLSFQATDKNPLLWLSEHAAFSPGKAVRGGIPLCFPWFGPHPTDTNKPAHGFARHKKWQLLSITQNENACTIKLHLQHDAETLALWPHHFEAELTVTLSHTLTLDFNVRNRDDREFPLTFAFHTYFHVSDIRRAQVTGLENTAFIDTLRKETALQKMPQAIRFEQEIDRVYLQTAENYQLWDEISGNVTHITSNNCCSAIVWNPWQEKTDRLTDMQGTAWQQMVCVECGRVESDAITLAPAESQCFSLQLSSV